MALINFSVTVDGILGSVGGVTFSANNSGSFLLPRSVGPRRASARQTVARSRFSSMPGAWRDLSDSQRDAWNAWAQDPAQEYVNRVGATARLLGWQWFERINIRLLNAGRAARVDPPDTGVPTAPTVGGIVGEVTAGVPSVVVSWDGSEFSGGLDLVIYALSGWNASRTVAPGKGGRVFGGTPPGSDDLEIAPELGARFGPVTAGQGAWAFIFAQSPQGQRSAALAVGTAVVEV